MPTTLPVEVFEVFERAFGREDAKLLIKSLERVTEEEIIHLWQKTKEDILKEVATKEELEHLRAELLERMEKNKTEILGRIEKDKAEILGRIEKDRAEILGRIEKDKIEILGRIEKDRAEILGRIERVETEIIGNLARLNVTLKFLIILMIIALTLMNPVMAEIIKNLLGL